MHPTVIGVIVFAFTFGGSLVGIWLHGALPEHHLDADSKDTVKVGFGLIATMTALVLGLVTASAKASFDAMDTAMKQTAIDVLTLDRALARYGPETGEIRTGLKHTIGERMEMIWQQNSSTPTDLDLAAEGLAEAIRGLRPRDDSQRALQSRALDLAEALLQARWVALASTQTSVPVPFLVVLLFWLTITFTSFGLFAPRNPTVLAVFFVCAVSVGSAVFLVLEMDAPFDGMLKVSPDALRSAYALLNQ